MSENPISNEIALRIALAARELPDTDAKRLILALKGAVGLPPTAKKLSGLTVKGLKTAADGEFSDVDGGAIKAAVGCLKGESGISSDPLPEIQSYSEGEMPNSIRVGCASNKSGKLDGHFGSCSRFLIYQVSQQEYRLVDIRNIDDSRADGDKNAYRASLINDCQLLFVASIGGPAAARIVRAGVHPIKKPQAGTAEEEVQSLQQVIGNNAPPWLAKVMGQAPEERIRFEQEAEV